MVAMSLWLWELSLEIEVASEGAFKYKYLTAQRRLLPDTLPKIISLVRDVRGNAAAVR